MPHEDFPSIVQHVSGQLTVNLAYLGPFKTPREVSSTRVGIDREGTTGLHLHLATVTGARDATMSLVRPAA